jgi:hypothetical protein
MKGWSLVLVSGLTMLVLGLGGVSFYLWQNQNKESGQTQGISDLVLENQEAGWKTHTSPLGYSLTFPANYLSIKNQGDNGDLYIHEISGQTGQIPAGSIYMKRQKTNLKDLDQIYELIKENLIKANQSDEVLQNNLINRKDLTLENGTKVIEFDQTGVEEYHNILLVNGGYVYNLGYKTQIADSVLINYFNKMYPTIKFTNNGGGKDSWELHQAATLGITFRVPPGWVVQETTTSLTIFSPTQNELGFSATKTLSLESGGKKYLIPVGGGNAEVTLSVDKNNFPEGNSQGFGHIDNSVYLSLNFSSTQEDQRQADWETMQEIIRSVAYTN